MIFLHIDIVKPHQNKIMENILYVFYLLIITL